MYVINTGIFSIFPHPPTLRAHKMWSKKLYSPDQIQLKETERKRQSSF